MPLINPLNITSGSTTITVTEPAHGRSTSDTVVFRNVNGSPGGVAYTVFESGAGYAITKVNSDKYTFTLGATPTVTENGGGMTVTAGPVLSGLALVKPCPSDGAGFGWSCGCLASYSETCTNAPFHSFTISLYGNSIPDLSDMALAYLPFASSPIIILHSKS